MQKKDTNSFQPLGICHKLFNFIMNSIIARGLKRISTGRPASHDSTELPIQESSRNAEKPTKTIKSNGGHRASSEIIVEFRHTDGLENWTTVINEEDTPILSGDQTQLQKIPLVPNPGVPNGTSLSQVQERIDSKVQGKGPHELEPPPTTGVPRKGTEKTAAFKDSAGEKGKNIATENLSLVIEPEEGTKMKPPRHPSPSVYAESILWVFVRE
ncbi:hypothetical protein F0562_002593 [Nyssa sinensis]|uniref:Uncharacterized protein n=1 Tax=Nyssa sinensis TaxID=561372 RepID=A0A5J5C6V2_9ASTE|nr:hypothetical protein F0562_002593 [Nyssa sinensis]